jgi:hypothetical protein
VIEVIRDDDDKIIRQKVTHFRGCRNFSFLRNRPNEQTDLPTAALSRHTGVPST